jgi:transposase
VPDAAHEAMRDRIRARAAAVEDLGRCRQCIAGFLLRQEIRYAGKPWTNKHRVWLGRLAFAAQAHQLMFGEMLEGLDQAMARRARLIDHIGELVPNWSLAWLVEALQALRGYRLVNAAGLVAEIGDPRRFASPRELMGYLGMVPSEHSTGDTVRRDG